MIIKRPKVPFLLTCVLASSLRTPIKANGETGIEDDLPAAKEATRSRHHQQVPSSSIPSSSSWPLLPFSQWRWFNSIHSLPKENPQFDAEGDEESSYDRMASSLINDARSNDERDTSDDDSTLSLVLLLDDTQQELEGKTISKSKDSHLSSSLAKQSNSLVPQHLLPPLTKRCSGLGQGEGRCRRGGQASMIPAEEVKQGWEDEYTSLPDVIIEFSQKQAWGEGEEREAERACNDLSVHLFRVDLREHYLEPVWVRQIAHLGACPSHLQTRHLGMDVWPSTVVEVKCLCYNRTCSNLGGDFRCQAVRKPIRTWVRHRHKFIPMQEMITVGCVCVQRTSPQGKYANLPIQS